MPYRYLPDGTVRHYRTLPPTSAMRRNLLRAASRPVDQVVQNAFGYYQQIHRSGGYSTVVPDWSKDRYPCCERSMAKRPVGTELDEHQYTVGHIATRFGVGRTVLQRLTTEQRWATDCFFSERGGNLPPRHHEMMGEAFTMMSAGISGLRTRLYLAAGIAPAEALAVDSTFDESTLDSLFTLAAMHGRSEPLHRSLNDPTGQEMNLGHC